METPHFYFLSILVLALSDSLAALVGTKYGAHPVRVDANNRKSIEGSAAFFVCTFVILTVGLPVLVGMPVGKALCCAALASVTLTVIELMSLSGRDNLFIPVGCMAVLLPIV